MPDREKVDDILDKLLIYTCMFHGPGEAEVIYKSYIIELYEEIFGKGERPKSMIHDVKRLYLQADAKGDNE